MSFFQGPDLIQAEQSSSNFGVNSNSIRNIEEGLYGSTSAVYIDNLCKSYKNGNPVLRNFCMNVNKGTIFGLLGSSGCGKTTAVSCIVGLAKWNSGEVKVLGRNVGFDRNAVEKKWIGYMPQDLALYNNLSISEVVKFYGRVYGMPENECKERLKILLKLLELPTQFRKVRDLSGGQRRRASLALALIHSPQLLVLDEPTVGLDPLLRVRIWDYLNELVCKYGITIIITTHYTEEVRAAHKIGVMRNGRLVFQDTPQTLLAICRCDLLEVGVLQLSKDDENRSCPIDSFDAYQRKSESSKPKITNIKSSRNLKPLRIDFCSTTRKVYGLSTVIFLNSIRSKLFLAAALSLLAFLALIIGLTIGTPPLNLQFGIVNHEVPNWAEKCKILANYTESCQLQALSCSYLEELKQDSLFSLTSYENEDDALSHVHLGYIRGYLKFSSNYSQHVYNMGLEKRFASPENTEGARISVYLDFSEYSTAFFVVKHLYGAFFRYLQNTATLCGINANEVSLPISFRKPVHGNYEDTFVDFILPGAIIGTILTCLSGCAAVYLIDDRKQGTFSRARVAGITLSDIILSYLINLEFLLFLQLIILEAVLYFYFDFVFVGSVWLSLLLCMLTGCCAVFIGIFIGTVFDEELEAIHICAFLGPAMVLYGGVLWPTESMSPFWQYVGNIVPVSLPSYALRSIIIRGLGMSYSAVWWGFLALIIWCIVLLIGSILGNKVRSV